LITGGTALFKVVEQMPISPASSMKVLSFPLQVYSFPENPSIVAAPPRSVHLNKENTSCLHWAPARAFSGVPTRAARDLYFASVLMKGNYPLFSFPAARCLGPPPTNSKRLPLNEGAVKGHPRYDLRFSRLSDWKFSDDVYL